ncbi:hypothetical protein [Herbiconiux sp. A18JL235]|uniref:HNH nuclease domain-containing protein n=1 Tax=Herbiconiux sp. A18JL235 TaxID=3152363 RepID=A0AB39BFN5_9MICO
MLYLARSIEDDDDMIVEHVDGMPVDAEWHREREKEHSVISGDALIERGRSVVRRGTRE